MRLRVAAVLALLMGAFLFTWGSAAQAAPGEQAPSASTPFAADKDKDKGPVTVISGVLQNTAEGNEAVPGVTIRVTTSEGDTLETESDESGRYQLKVPATGETKIELVTDTLPEGVQLREGIQNPLTVTLDSGRPSLSTVFAVGPDNRAVESWYDRVPQTIWDGAYFGIVLALGALGLSMVFGTTGLTNFSHGELVTFGAIMTYVFNVAIGWPIWVAGLLAMICAAAFGYLQDTLFWRRLRHRGTGLIAMMIVSIGLQFLLRNAYQYGTGGQTLNYDDYMTPDASHALGVDYTTRDLIIIAIAVVLLLSVTIALQKTRIGRATRAVADNPALAASSGINVDRVITVVWTVGTMLAGACGVMLGFTQSVKFDLGAQVLLVMFAAITVGGLGSVWGAIIGSVVVGILIEMSTLIIPAELKIATALFVLIVVLMVRPQGLLGRKERVG
ncbi:branched-chain amino acid ABC transporter permease [Solicola gregarius]|uniref:Branched-chain amino acid ABC transporter permease n=1 Tax=Solicola gregarius TaxID=2908642 RepID=A0AA46YL98_9ACTN|nr:branched-chain amino acid ABC transporter permease [Solicola gregarius]UYM05306.1 branched-chain amino acid ABC transporter permease [Solicola gregarius]